MFPFLINPITTIFVSISTATGVFVHDTHIDKAAATALTAPAVMAYEANTKQMSLIPDLHTHSERGSLSQAVHDLKTQNPRIQPRATEDKKHLLQKRVAKGHHAFDNYSLPIV